MKESALLFILLSVGGISRGQSSILGQWNTIDDETGEAKSVVEVYEKEGKVFGKIIKLFPNGDEDPDPICNLCPKDDPRFKQKIIGMEIIKNLKKDGDEYTGGTVLKPDEGKIFKCKIWLENENLKIRGYWGFFYRTQTWVRAR
ncbi:MAG: DUF2147 domain-containing protein [Bacteroidota bacterium]